MKYIAKKPYRCSYDDQAEIEKQVKELLENGIIEQSCSPFAAPVTMAYKKVGEGKPKEKVRMCVDFRELNKLLVPESQPFPLIEDTVVRTRDCGWFTALDWNSAFWSIPVRVKDRFKTAFITQQGHYQWKSMPFGMKNSPAIFQRILSGIIRRNNLEGFCINYIDDVLVFSKTFEEHVKHVVQVLEAIKKKGFKLKFTKCSFAKHSVNYLGHIIEKNTVRPLQDNLISIRNFPIPTCRKNIRQFLGKINFYNKYIENASRMLEPFHRLLRKDVPFEWTTECQEAFEKVKTYLTSSPVLAIFDQNKPIKIYTDASGEGIGAILKQPQADGEKKPVAYFSKKLDDSQKKKKAIYIESYAVREAVKFWRYWLIGKKFTVITDHKPLEKLNLKSRPDEELGDIANYLLQYDFEIIYRPGTENAEADCLSRNPVMESGNGNDEIKEPIRTVNLVTIEEIKSEQKKNIEKSEKIFERDGVLMKKVRKKDKIVLTEKLGRELIERIHIKYGHIGASKIYVMLKEHYTFKNMYKTAVKLTTTCETCLCNKTRRRNDVGLLGHFGPAKRPYEIMSLDTVGGFGGQRSTKKYLHILIDHFTRYAYIHTSKNQNAPEFIRLIKKVQQEHQIGCLLTDQYGGLTSVEFLDFLEEERINHYYTAVNNPASNGMNERAGQTLVNRIRCRMNEKDNKQAWANVANKCTNEYNTTVHSSTKFTPAYLMYGKTEPISPFQSVSDYSGDLILAYNNSLIAHEKNKTRYDQGREETILEIGEEVYIENGNRLNRTKLDEVRIGPFKIKRKIANTVYEVETGGQGIRNTRLYHVSKIVKKM
jgi:transposase InsO family protein